MDLFKKTCKNPKCGKEFMGVRTQQYCCPEHRIPKGKGESKSDRKVNFNHNRNNSITEIAVEARKLGMSYGQYVSMKYIEEQRERMNKNAE